MNCHVIVQRYYRNDCSAYYEYHYRQVLADPVLNFPEKAHFAIKHKFFSCEDVSACV